MAVPWDDRVAVSLRIPIFGVWKNTITFDTHSYLLYRFMANTRRLHVLPRICRKHTHTHTEARRHTPDTQTTMAKRRRRHTHVARHTKTNDAQKQKKRAEWSGLSLFISLFQSSVAFSEFCFIGVCVGVRAPHIVSGSTRKCVYVRDTHERQILSRPTTYTHTHTHSSEHSNRMRADRIFISLHSMFWPYGE